MNLDRKRFAVGFALVFAALLALPALAAGRVAYFTGSEGSAGGYAAPIELASQTPGNEIPTGFGSEGGPPDVAITPDGKTAYVANQNPAEIIPIDVATNTREGGIALGGGEAEEIAITPDGRFAFVIEAFPNRVDKVDLSTGTVVATIPLSEVPGGIAVAPNGNTAYVSVQGSPGSVLPIDVATATTGSPIEVGTGPTAVSVTPDGNAVYVLNSDDATISRIDAGTQTVTATITGTHGERLVITPDGSKAYALDSSELTPVNLTTGVAGATKFPSGFVRDIAILPDGSRAYLTANDGGSLIPVVVANDEEELPFLAHPAPNAIAIVPNQPPVAAFSSSPAPAKVGEAVSFDASGTTDPDSSLPIARYEWDFGDGTVVASGGVKPQHTYAKPGTYQVTLTTTDGEGCSTKLVFTGQTAYCNGSSVARTTHPVVVGGNGLNVCSGTKASASTFIPKRRPGNIVPGVRVKISTAVPSKVTVTATALYWQSGKQASAQLGKITATIEHWRQVRFAIPPELHTALPLGKPLKVQVRMESEPVGGVPCEAAVATRVLKVHVVKVFPNRVQFERSH